MFCPYCGRTICEVRGFCPGCGANLGVPTPTPTPTGAQNAGPQKKGPNKRVVAIAIAGGVAALCVLGAVLFLANMGPGCSLPGFLDAQEKEDEARKEERLHWVNDENRLHQHDKNSSEEPQAYDSKKTYERDDQGRLIKVTNLSWTYKGDAYSEEYKGEPSSDSGKKDAGEYQMVREYEYDSKGWPTKETLRSGSTFDYDGKKNDSLGDPEVTTFKYERDDEDRVTKITASGHTDLTMAYKYDKAGKIRRITRTQKTSDYDRPSDDREITEKEVTEFEDGKLVASKTTKESKDGTIYYMKDDSYNEKEDLVKSVITRPQKDDDDLVTTFDYEVTYERGKVVKTIARVKGDGVTEEEVYIGDNGYMVTYMPDGSISARERLEGYSWEEENLGRAKTYEGPYETTTYTYSDKGYCTEYGETYFDGSETIEKNEYDEWGNTLSGVMDRGSSYYQFEYEQHRIDEPTEFMRQHGTMRLFYIMSEV